MFETEIKSLCSKYGFYKSGFSNIQKFDDKTIESDAVRRKLRTASGFFKQWLSEGKHAAMHWLESSFEKRINPHLIFEQSKSIISLAYIYNTPFVYEEDNPKISRYGWGKDYHKVLKKKLKLLCCEIEALGSNIETKFYVDDGPLMEKYWAVNSGIGWQGKNSLAIIPEAGSFFYLSDILINIELKEDEPITDMCGSCNLCVSSCPTGALDMPYSLNPNRCISYHTLENREETPSNMDVYGWIFGCDICQDVCPYNKRKIFSEDSDFNPNQYVFNKRFEELTQFSEDEFNEIFSDSPIKRIKCKGWKRNLNLYNSDLRIHF